jgi:hypothetical protein
MLTGSPAQLLTFNLNAVSLEIPARPHVTIFAYGGDE